MFIIFDLGNGVCIINAYMTLCCMELHALFHIFDLQNYLNYRLHVTEVSVLHNRKPKMEMATVNISCKPLLFKLKHILLRNIVYNELV